MKTNRSFILLVAVAGLAACSKKNEPAPDLAAQLAGTYQVLSIALGAGAQPLPLPQNGVSATLKLEKAAGNPTQVTYSATTNNRGIVTTSAVETLDLAANGNDVDLSKKGAKIGTWSNNTLSITDTTPGGQKISYVASR